MLFALFLMAAPQSDALPDRAQTPRFTAAPAAPICRNAKMVLTGRDDAPVRVRRLGEEPTANLYLGVLRYEGKCEKPVMIRQDIGGSADDQR
ncbi:MAG: hypothetical protein WDN44_00065 [Sphingomonas sp.]